MTVSIVLSAALGGVLIGLAASMLLLFNGRIAGISGILGGALTPLRGDLAWRLAFMGGMLAGGLALLIWLPGAIHLGISRSLPAFALAGVAVGYGTQLGGGCTSGHGICGNGRLMPRSLVATLMFTVTGAIAVYAINHLLGGRL